MLSTRPFSRRQLRLERLETREVPATLVSPTTLTYQDFDGDDVKVVFSKPILGSTMIANSIFTFDTSNVSGGNATKQQLQTIDLTVLAVGVTTGTTITTTATRNAVNGGDGFAALGQINASSLNLGLVKIDGDLGRVFAGDGMGMATGLA